LIILGENMKTDVVPHLTLDDQLKYYQKTGQEAKVREVAYLLFKRTMFQGFGLLNASKLLSEYGFTAEEVSDVVNQAYTKYMRENNAGPLSELSQLFELAPDKRKALGFVVFRKALRESPKYAKEVMTQYFSGEDLSSEVQTAFGEMMKKNPPSMPSFGAEDYDERPMEYARSMMNHFGDVLVPSKDVAETLFTFYLWTDYSFAVSLKHKGYVTYTSVKDAVLNKMRYDFDNGHLEQVDALVLEFLVPAMDVRASVLESLVQAYEYLEFEKAETLVQKYGLSSDERMTAVVHAVSEQLYDYRFRSDAADKLLDTFDLPVERQYDAFCNVLHKLVR